MREIETILREVSEQRLAPTPSVDALHARVAGRRRRRRRQAAVLTVASVLTAALVASQVLIGGERATKVRTAGGVTVALDDVPTGVSTRVVDGVPLFVVRAGRAVHAFLARPTHLENETLWWCPSEQVFVSPMHGEAYAVDGSRIEGPSPRGLDAVRVRVTGAGVRIDPDAVITGPVATASPTSRPPVVPSGNWQQAGFCTDHIAAPAGTRGPAAVTTLPAQAWTPCPGSVPRRGIEGGDVGADALPPVSGAIMDRTIAEHVAVARQDGIRRDYQDVKAVSVSRGFGRAWKGEAGGAYTVVDVDDFAIEVELGSLSACPTGADLHVGVDGVPLFFGTRTAR